MSATVSHESAAAFADCIGTKLGLSLSVERWDDLTAKIACAARNMGFDDDERFTRWVLATQAEAGRLESLASYLTVGETYFYRESNSLEAIERHAFAAIARERKTKQLRIWSAGCATGEEPYTLAMMASEHPGFRDWNVTIVGSDINEAFLRRAQAGTYTEWSFRGVPPRIKAEYFRKTGRSTYEITDRIKRMVVFEHVNLVGDEYPTLTTNTNAMDLVLCRNVLMYFRPSIIEKVVGKLRRSLVDGGWLVVSPIEGSLIADPELVAVKDAGAVLYRKSGAPAVDSRPSRPSPAPWSKSTARPRRRATDPLPPVAAQGGAAAGCGAASRAADPRADELTARAHANAGRLAEAEEWCLRAIRGDKLSATGRFLLATVLIERGQLERAAAALRQAIYIAPSLAMPHFALGNLMLRRANTEDARRHFARALELLAGCDGETLVPEAEGLTAARLSEIIRSLLRERVQA